MKKIWLQIVIALVLVAVLIIPLQAQGGVTGFSNLRISNFYRAQPRTVILVSMNGSINPTGTYQPISASVGSAVSVSGDNLTTKPAGTVLTLVNIGAQNIVITETANMFSAGNLTLGVSDTVTFYSNGSNWFQVSASNN